MPRQCGAWRLDREIGQGAYGVVCLALGPGGERAAVKVCRHAAVGDERYARELRGAKLYRSIPPQDGLVRMRDLVETTWGFYTVMDLADDEFGAVPESGADYRPKTLARVVEGEKALPLKECVRLALSLAKGLDALQRHHLLHRDIKPGNVLYVKGRPVLSDPGLLVEESDAASLVGTPGYVPPEKFTGSASDIYSLGLTLKAASFGRQVEDLDKGPSMEADAGAALFPAWWRILNKATNPTPSRRYQSAKALIKDLKALRFRMEIASKFGSRAAKAAGLAASITVVAFIGVLVVSNGRMSDEVSAQKNEIVRQRGDVSAQRAEIDRQIREMSAQREWIDRQAKEISAQREQIERQNKDMSAQRAQIDRQNKEMAAQRAQIDRQDKEMVAQRAQIDRQNKEMTAQNKEMSAQREQIDRQEKEIAGHRNEIARQQETIKSQNREIAGRLDEIARYRDEIARQRNEIDKRAQEVARQAKDISGQIEVHSILTGNETNLVAELQSLRQFKTDTENMFEKARREALWGAYCADLGLWELQLDNHKRAIAEIAMKDKTKSVELQARLDRLVELLEKDKSYHKAIVDLRDKAMEKDKRGLDSTDEFLAAERIYKERLAFEKNEFKPLEKELEIAEESSRTQGNRK